MKILVIDNYDSFVYNLVHLIKEVIEEKDLDASVDVFRNDQIDLDKVEKYDKVLLSPGPGIPSDAGICLDVIKRYGGTKSILGVCLGHQAIAEAYGGKLYNMPKVLHGVDTFVEIQSDKEYLFFDVPSRTKVCRYHSWAVEPEDLGGELVATAVDDHGEVMALSHPYHDVRGVQFHPESILTSEGKVMITNWLSH
ncbi:anthranilate synthase component II [Aureibacter tunicatorum]|nr:aminodeoxychorismate/anthranilate synthase component II [Aureibacter tunicatorum]